MMISIRIVAVTLALIGIVVIDAAYLRRLRRNVKRNLSAREPVPAGQFGAKHYSDAGRAEVATFIVSRLQELTGYDFTGVLPTDRLADDLHLDAINSLAVVEIVMDVEARFGVVITSREATATKTLDDFVQLVASKRVDRAR